MLKGLFAKSLLPLVLEIGWVEAAGETESVTPLTFASGGVIPMATPQHHILSVISNRDTKCTKVQKSETTCFRKICLWELRFNTVSGKQE